MDVHPFLGTRKFHDVLKLDNSSNSVTNFQNNICYFQACASPFKLYNTLAPYTKEKIAELFSKTISNNSENLKRSGFPGEQAGWRRSEACFLESLERRKRGVGNGSHNNRTFSQERKRGRASEVH